MRCAPHYPAEDRLWSIVEKYRVSIFYTAPTAIRTFMKWAKIIPTSMIHQACDS
ncbi:MAG: hypothetical protein R2865_02785 [Deinococcales bacterium]